MWLTSTISSLWESFLDTLAKSWMSLMVRSAASLTTDTFRTTDDILQKSSSSSHCAGGKASQCPVSPRRWKTSQDCGPMRESKLPWPWRTARKAGFPRVKAGGFSEVCSWMAMAALVSESRCLSNKPRMTSGSVGYHRCRSTDFFTALARGASEVWR